MVKGVAASLGYCLKRHFLDGTHDLPARMAAALTFMGLSIALWVPSFNIAVPSIAPSKSELGRAYARSTFYRSVISVPAPWVGGMLYSVAPVLPMVAGALSLIADVGVLRAVARTVPTRSERSQAP